MDRRQFIGSLMCGFGAAAAGGCRGKQYAKVMKPGESDMVGSHTAGGETFKPLIEESVANLLTRHCPQPMGPNELPAPPKRICFVCVENKSAEEIGDFKDEIYQIIDSKIVDSHLFQPVSRRYVEAGLAQARLRPDQLFIPANMRAFSAVMEQQGQPFDYVLYATLTSGTTHQNKNYEREYTLTMEMNDLHCGTYDKQLATISKSYYHTRVGKLASFNPFK